MLVHALAFHPERSSESLAKKTGTIEVLTGAIPKEQEAEVIRMCRNIKTLYNFEPPATDDEIQQAALQFVRKISGFPKPSAANQAAFKRAVDEITASSAKLLRSLATAAPPRNREAEAAKARARAVRRFSS